MRKNPSNFYRHPFPADFEKRLEDVIDSGCRQAAGEKALSIFFRADDIGVPSAGFTELISLFKKHNTPLCLATVPSWLTRKRFAILQEATGDTPSLWCWHQHGRLHRNFEPHGKNQEFGPARDYATLKYQIKSGRQRLEEIMGETFQPFFTPPWNRCCEEAARALKDLHFFALSRSKGAQPDVSAILPDIHVNVDLHTTKEPNPAAVFENLLEEIENSLASGRCGIMIHHQRMNRNAYFFLDVLLHLLNNRKEAVMHHFRDIFHLSP